MESTSLPPPLPSLPSEEKIWVVLCHLSLFIGVGFLLPLVVYLVKKQDVPLTAEHAKEVLNFHISVYLYAAVAFVLCFVLIGVPLLMLIGVASLVFGVIAAIKASEGQFYRYPLTIRFF